MKKGVPDGSIVMMVGISFNLVVTLLDPFLHVLIYPTMYDMARLEAGLKRTGREIQRRWSSAGLHILDREHIMNIQILIFLVFNEDDDFSSKLIDQRVCIS